MLKSACPGLALFSKACFVSMETILRPSIWCLVLLLLAFTGCGESPPGDDDTSSDDDDSSSDDDDSSSDDDDDSAGDDDDTTADDDDSAAGDDDDSAIPGGFLPGALSITEIFNNPQGTDEGREWFELFNPGPDAIDLDGWLLEDFHTNEYLIEQMVLVPAGGYAVLGETLAPKNLGTPIDLAYGLDMNGFPLGNNTDEVVVRSPGGVVIDAVAYDGGVTFPTAEGASLSLSPGATHHFANDMGWNWCLSTAGPFTKEGDLGSPGEANPGC